MKKSFRAVFVLAAMAALMTVGCAGETGPAPGEDGTPEGEQVAQTSSALTGVQKVCRYSSVRRSPGGQVFDFLSAGENFNIYRHCGTHSDGSPCYWYYGHAYGHVHEDGWIEESAFRGC